MDARLESALAWLPVADMTREEWITVGMALKEEGVPYSVWDAWSRNDKRYRKGECERLWKGFQGASKPVRGGSIIQMAKDRGWTPYGGSDGSMGWDDVIEYDGDMQAEPKPWNQTGELISYLSALFDSDDYVAYVTNDVWQGEEGRWLPGKGCFDRTAGEIIDSLRKHEDIADTIGDWKPEAGAWIRFNPVDGKGVKNENITAWRHALVESDTLSIEQQREAYARAQLPIACLVSSGGKSLHAIVKVDAANAEEYRERVNFLYEYMKESGVEIDRQNSNPSRLSRMPGVTRNGKRQELLGTNLGRKSWSDWVAWVQGSKLPPIVSLADYDMENPPPPPPELIHGILRRGHKMIITGASKAGKSFLLAELSIAIASGGDWLGFKCEKGKVLYVNFEIDGNSFIKRYSDIYKAMEADQKDRRNIFVWNMRGYAEPMNDLTGILIQQMVGQNFDAVIIDPLYKVTTGDENSASDMARFCNEFDKIATQTGAAVIYCHHHSKGAQGGKKAQDRGSGSGVFARDPDAILDIVELELTEQQRLELCDGNETAWRLESSLREFANIRPVNFWFDWPLHRVDTAGLLDDEKPDGAPKSDKRTYTTKEERRSALMKAYMSNAIGSDEVPLSMIAEYLGVSERSVRNYCKEFPSLFSIKNGQVCAAEGGD